MKTWDDWSDFEINKALFPFTRDFGKCEDIMQKKNPNRSAVMWGDGANWFEFDCCNSWADIGHILLDKGIGMVAENGKLIGATTSSQQYYEPYGDVIYSYDHVNPLRAAAIVFLMMNGVNPE